MSRRATFLIVTLAYAVAVYQLPYVLTLARTGWSPLPPVFDSDQMLYLNLSSLHHASATEVVNPWYGNSVAAVDVPHLRFPIAFLLFAVTHSVLHSWTVATMAWVAIWVALSFIAALYCLAALFPDSRSWFRIAAAFALLVLQSPLVYAAAAMQLPSLRGMGWLQLPYLRFAIPQVIVPAVLAYWGLQVGALNTGSKRALALMALLQFAVFITFPYILPVVALGTGATIVLAKSRNREIAWSWSAICVFALLCGVVDIGYFVLTGLGSHANVQLALQFRPEMILPSVRPYQLLLVLVAGLVMFSRASLAARATVAGLAISNALCGFSDVFLPTELQVLDHPNYIIALTTWLPLLVLLWASMEKLDSRALRISLLSLLTLIGAWEGFASYRSRISINQLQAAAVHEVENLSLTGNDLVVAPSRFADDISSWIPLVSPAKVLYTSDGENILSAADTQKEQAFRQAVYLMMAGMNSASLNSMTDPGSPDSGVNALVQQSDRALQRSPLAVDRLRARRLVRQRLGPIVAQLESDPALAGRVFGGAGRIVILESSKDPVFQQTAFTRWLQIERQYDHNGARVWICRPRLKS